MADISGDGLHWVTTMDNDRMNGSVDETLRRIKGLSDGTVAYGDKADVVFAEATVAVDRLKRKLADLKEEQKNTEAAIASASKNGLSTDALKASYEEVTKKIKETELRIGEYEQSIRKANDTHRSLKQELKDVSAQMAQMRSDGQENTQVYDELKRHAGELRDTLDDVNRQIRVMANDESQFQGVITGLSGLSGGFSAATGALSLFSSENENLQKIMTKLQSVMAIAIGMQQVAQVLNKDSAFRQVTVNGLKEWWNRILAKAVVVEKAETEAIVENTVAAGANAAATGAGAAAAGAGVKANIGLAASFRAVGLAIKSIPVFGWILAGVSALVAVIVRLTRAAREAKKEQQEFFKTVAENASKPVGAIIRLQTEWNRLGDDLKAKERFLRDNKQAFDELGVAIKGVADAENLLVKNKTKFVDAQIAKAKSLAVIESEAYKAELKKSMDAKLLFDKEVEKFDKRHPDQVAYLFDKDHYYFANKSIEDQWKKMQESNKKLKAYQNQALDYWDEYNSELEKGGFKTDDIIRGSIKAYEAEISALREKQKDVTDKSAFDAIEEQIKSFEQQIEAITGKQKDIKPDKEVEDAFAKMLSERKKQYEDYFKWVNAGFAEEAEKEFASLRTRGRTYKEFLEGLLAEGGRSAEEVKQIRDAIVGETDRTMLDVFKDGVNQLLEDAETVEEKLKALEKMRDELNASEDEPLKVRKVEIVNEAYEGLSKKQIEDEKAEIQSLMENYASYLDQRISLRKEFLRKEGLLIKQFDKAEKDEQRASIEAALANLRAEYAEKESMIDISELESSELYKRTTRIVEDESRKQLKARIEALEAYILTLKTSTEEEKAYYNTISNYLRDAKRDLNQKTVDSFRSVADTMNTIIQHIGNTNDKLAETARAIAESAINIYQSFQTDNKAGQVTGIVSGILSITAAFRDWRYAAMDVIDPLGDKAKLYDQIAGSVEVTNMRLARQKLLLEDVTGLDNIQGKFDLLESYRKKEEDAMNKLNARTFEYINSQKEYFKDSDNTWARVLGGIFHPAVAIANLINPGKLEAGGVNMVGNYLTTGGQMKTEIEYEFKSIDTSGFKDIEDYRDLLYEIKANGGKIYGKDVVESDIKALEELITAYDEAIAEQKKLMKELKEALTDTTAGAISSSIAQAFMEGKHTAKDFSEYFDTLMRNSLRNIFQIRVLETMFNDFYEEFAAKTLDGISLSAEDIKELSSSFKEKITSAEEQWGQFEQIMNDAGINMRNDRDTSLTGAVKGITEEQAGIIGGQLNAYRVNQLDQTLILRDILLRLANIERNTENIDRNTQYIKGIHDRMNAADPLRAHGYH